MNVNKETYALPGAFNPLNGKSMNPFVFSQGSTSNAAFAQIAKILKIALFKDASERINLKAG